MLSVRLLLRLPELHSKKSGQLPEARVLCEGFRREYNEERPHQSLVYKTPQEFKQQWLQQQSENPGD